MKNCDKLCEIAFISGRLVEEGLIDFDEEGLQEMYTSVYAPIMKEWEDGLGKGIFKNTEEEGYISAYAQRRLIELYNTRPHTKNNI